MWISRLVNIRTHFASSNHINVQLRDYETRKMHSSSLIWQVTSRIQMPKTPTASPATVNLFLVFTFCSCLALSVFKLSSFRTKCLSASFKAENSLAMSTFGICESAMFTFSSVIASTRLLGKHGMQTWLVPAALKLEPSFLQDKFKNVYGVFNGVSNL